MSKKKWVRVVTRTSTRVRATLKRLVADIGEAKVLAQREGVITQEVFIAASWLWMSKLDPEELATKISPFIDTAQAIFYREDMLQDPTKQNKDDVDMESLLAETMRELHVVVGEPIGNPHVEPLDDPVDAAEEAAARIKARHEAKSKPKR